MNTLYKFLNKVICTPCQSFIWIKIYHCCYHRRGIHFKSLVYCTFVEHVSQTKKKSPNGKIHSWTGRSKTGNGMQRVEE